MLSKFRAFLDISILCGVVVGSLMSFLGLFAAFFPALDILNHFQFVFLIITLVCLITTYVWPFYYPGFKRIGRMILMVPLVSSLSFIGPEYYRSLTSPSLPATPDGKVLKVMSFNIYMGNWDRPGTASSIIRHDPDIVLMQEYTPNRFKNQPDLKKRYPYQARCRSWRRCTLAILSKYPMDELQSRALGPEDKRDFVHGKMLSATLRLPGYQPLRIHTFHADWPTPTKDQKPQFAELREVLQKDHERYDAMLLGGDFNSTGWSYALNRFADGAGMTRHTQFLLTFPTLRARIKRLRWPAIFSLDHLMTSPAMSMGNVERITDASVGDHYPVAAEFILKKAQ